MCPFNPADHKTSYTQATMSHVTAFSSGMAGILIRDGTQIVISLMLPLQSSTRVAPVSVTHELPELNLKPMFHLHD